MQIYCSSFHRGLKAVLGVALGFGVLALQAAEPTRQTLTKTLRPMGAAAGPAVVITYEAAVYDPAESVATTGTVPWNTRTPEAAFQCVFLANKLGDTNLIVRGFVPAERERIAGMVAQPEMLSKNTASYAKIASVWLLQKTFYGEYIILTTAQEDSRGNQWPASYAFKRTAEGWLLTNELASDPVYAGLVDLIAPKSPPKSK